MKNVQKGFTLIELMIVVAIIAILAAIALPAYQDYTIRSQVSEGAVLSDGAKTAVAEFYTNKGYFPNSNVSAGLAASGSIAGNYVIGLSVSTGLLTAKYGNKASSKVTNSQLVFSAYSKGGGSIAWTCKAASSSPVPAKYLPTSCR